MGATTSRRAEGDERPKAAAVTAATTRPPPARTRYRPRTPPPAPTPAPDNVLTDLQEIQELESTFDSLGIPLYVDNNANVSVLQEPPPPPASAPVTAPAPAPAPSSPSPLQQRAATPKNKASVLTRQPAVIITAEEVVSSALGTSETPEPTHEGAYTYSQKDIDGFDVEKFRKANRKAATPPEEALPHRTDLSSTAALHPLQFPFYDSNEEQLLAGIVEEFSS